MIDWAKVAELLRGMARLAPFVGNKGSARALALGQAAELCDRAERDDRVDGLTSRALQDHAEKMRRLRELVRMRRSSSVHFHTFCDELERELDS